MLKKIFIGFMIALTLALFIFGAAQGIKWVISNMFANMPMEIQGE